MTMKPYSALNRLVPFIVLLALLTTFAGVFTPPVGHHIRYQTVRGETVKVWGQGLHKYDTPIGATGFTAADAITLFLAIPMLVISFLMYRQGSLKGGLLLSGALAYFLYNYTSMGFGATYNNMFLAYILIFSASLFGLILTLLSFDLETLPPRFGLGLPHNGIGTFLIVSGAILSFIWLVLSIGPALLAGKTPPDANYYTTFTIGIIDIGMVTAALILAGVLIRHGTSFGYLLTYTILAFTRHSGRQSDSSRDRPGGKRGHHDRAGHGIYNSLCDSFLDRRLVHHSSIPEFGRDYSRTPAH
jgi:hypothetical protein